MPLDGDRERHLRQLRALTARERRVVAPIGLALLALLAALVVALVAGGGGSTTPLPAGCVEVTAGSTMGGANYRACGRAADQWCRAQAKRDGSAARTVQARCREAGVP